jgi:hypothetical protein
MKQDLNMLATIKALTDAGLEVETILNRDPNTRRLLEALCIRYNVKAVYKDSPP